VGEKKMKTRGINEIKIKLLPEKAKRDYVLRLVSFIIVLTFVIINFLAVYIPYTNLNGKLQNLRSENAAKNLDVLYLQNKYNFFYQDIYNKNDGSIKDVLASNLDFIQIMLMFDNNGTYNTIHDQLTLNELLKPENNLRIKPAHSFVESIYFSEVDLSFTISIQFNDLNDLTSYEKQLQRIKYVSSVEIGNYTITTNYVKTTFKITIDPQNINCPKVGGYN